MSKEISNLRVELRQKNMIYNNCKDTLSSQKEIQDIKIRLMDLAEQLIVILKLTDHKKFQTAWTSGDDEQFTQAMDYLLAYPTN